MLLRAITCMAMQQIRRWRRACCCMRFCWVCSILLAGRLCVGNVLQTLDNSIGWFCCLGVACNGKWVNAASSIHAPCKAFLVCRAHEYWLCLFQSFMCRSAWCRCLRSLCAGFARWFGFDSGKTLCLLKFKFKFKFLSWLGFLLFLVMGWLMAAADAQR